MPHLIAQGIPMKTLLTLVLTLALATPQVLAQPQATPETTPISQHAYGLISANALLSQYSDFAAEYAAYQVSPTDIAHMQRLQNVSLLVLFGSWCHDSEREVSRLLKLLHQSDVALESLQLHAVNRQKQHPDGLEQKYALRFTPTIIVLRNGQELGRIIEQPQSSLAEDLARFITTP
jgi:thioredoxin 1